MISIEQAIERIRQNLPPRQEESVKLDEARGRILVRDVQAVEDAPRFTNSAMDGFALRFDDLQTLPAELKVVGESRAGVPFRGRLMPGQAVRISTGAVLPHGADSVVPIEDCRWAEDSVKVLTIKKRGANVRLKGEEITRGQLLLKSGSVLCPDQLALLAAQGIAQVVVFRQARVALLSTGTEVKPFDQAVKEYEIRDSNRVMLGEGIQCSGARLSVAAHLPDDLDLTVARLKEVARDADVVIFSGGVSVGPHDHVKTAAEQAGFQPILWKVNQQPGKPLFFARKENTLLFGLPGNPVSSFMSFVHYVFPALRYLQGADFAWPVLEAQSVEKVEINKKRPQLLRVSWREEAGTYRFRVLAQQGSHMISSISQANGYLVTAPSDRIEPKESRTIYLFPWRTKYGIC